MIIEDIIVRDTIVKKISPDEGFLLTDGEIVTDALFMSNEPSDGVWWEIPNPNYDGSDYLYPVTWENGMEVANGLWYTNGEDILEALKDGTPTSFTDREYFDIID